MISRCFALLSKRGVRYFARSTFRRRRRGSSRAARRSCNRPEHEFEEGVHLRASSKIMAEDRTMNGVTPVQLMSSSLT